MKLLEDNTIFNELVIKVAKWKNLTNESIIRDFYIVELLENLSNSEYVEQCVFKGGTSLSKCYPNSIERFSEDIDLTFSGMDLNDNKCDKILKRIEQTIIGQFNFEKIVNERNQRNKSSYIWHDNYSNGIKLEIGSQIRPDPYSKKEIKSYIYEYLEINALFDLIKKYELKKIQINALNIERTFIDKVMAIKRHAICGTLKKKVRHLYDIYRLLLMKDIQEFLQNKDELKRLLQLTKKTDSFYLNKRNLDVEYNSMGPYDFDSWKDKLNDEIKSIYENLHLSLLYNREKLKFSDVLNSLEYISSVFIEIGE